MSTLTTLFDRAGGRCLYCRCETYIPGNQSREATLARFGLAAGEPGVKRALRRRRATREHLVRIADGGGNQIANLGLACAFCNVTRGEATIDLHREAIARLVAAGEHPNHRGVALVGTGAERRAFRAAGLWSAKQTADAP